MITELHTGHCKLRHQLNNIARPVGRTMRDIMSTTVSPKLYNNCCDCRILLGKRLKFLERFKLMSSDITERAQDMVQLRPKTQNLGFQIC